ncbi:MAG: carboxypeptidase regulatory-like domain-containing protein, partial [Acidobacteria bacterium]|nr:carboxypeptidase regulatory-like domain-containing protein [Acidobacteriota bacterium]
MTLLSCTRLRAAFTLLIILGWLAPVPAAAQALYGSIVGTVTDAQGAVAPGVVLVATNTGTGLRVEAASDTEGAYVFRNLLPGTYNLTATLAGFREHTQAAIPVAAGNPVRVNIALAVGAVAESIEVVSQTTLLQTEKADLSTQLTAKEIINLPLNQ